MRNIYLTLFLFVPLIINAQERRYSTFYEQRNSLFESLQVTSADIVFLGNSITNGAEWAELFDDIRVKNRGISGDISEGVADRLDNIIKGCPAKIFLLTGINDIARNQPVDSITLHIRKIIGMVQDRSPHTKLYLQSVLPVNPDFKMFQGHMKPDTIQKLNRELLRLADQYSLRYIDLYTRFTEEGTDKLSPKYTNDGLHLLGDGYLLWRDILMPYIKE